MAAKHIEGMNAEQVEVIQAPAVPLLVAATAGSGKTRALVNRVARLVHDGADPTRILAVTFAAKAAKEMTQRLERLGCHDSRVGTFHSVSLQIVRAELSGISSWDVDDSERYRICVKDAVSYRYMDWKSADVTHLQNFIGRCKAAGGFANADDAISLGIATKFYRRRPSAARDPRLCCQAYEMAEMLRRERQILTFDDMLFEAWALLRSDEGARRRWAERWDHVLQDELQDESPVQHELGSMLARDHRSYTVVGDPAQAIYSFRGADPSLMMKFEAEWGARVVRMGRNYRCGSAIVDVANRTLSAMPAASHLGVEMVAECKHEGRVRVARYDDFDAEGEGVAESILESHEDGRDWRQHVVLFRTNAQSRGVEEALLSARAPYVVIGGTNFYDRKEVRDLLAYLRVAAGRGKFEDIKRSINTPFRFLGKAFISGLEEAVEDCSGPKMIDAVRSYVLSGAKLQQRQQSAALQYCGMMGRLDAVIGAGIDNATDSRESLAELEARPSALLESLVMDLRYNEWLTRDEGAESPENNRVSNVRELIRAAGRFPTTAELLNYIDDTIARAAKAKREARSSDVITLCSIFRAKGLEWPVVYVIGCNEKILPHAYAEDVNEERRLFYVACTRAIDVLELSCVAHAAVSNRVMDLDASRFLVEAGLGDMEVAGAGVEAAVGEPMV